MHQCNCLSKKYSLFLQKKRPTKNLFNQLLSKNFLISIDHNHFTLRTSSTKMSEAFTHLSIWLSLPLGLDSPPSLVWVFPFSLYRGDS